MAFKKTIALAWCTNTYTICLQKVGIYPLGCPKMVVDRYRPTLESFGKQQLVPRGHITSHFLLAEARPKLQITLYTAIIITSHTQCSGNTCCFFRQVAWYYQCGQLQMSALWKSWSTMAKNPLLFCKEQRVLGFGPSVLYMAHQAKKKLVCSN